MVALEGFVACADFVVQDQLADKRHQSDPLVPDLHKYNLNDTGMYCHAITPIILPCKAAASIFIANSSITCLSAR